jgi:hypothetical protein
MGWPLSVFGFLVSGFETAYFPAGTTGTYVYVIAITTSAGAVIDRKGTVELVH